MEERWHNKNCKKVRIPQTNHVMDTMGVTVYTFALDLFGLQIALRGRLKNRTGYLETAHIGRSNKSRLAVCSRAIVKQDCLVLVFFSRLDGYNQALLLLV